MICGKCGGDEWIREDFDRKSETFRCVDCGNEGLLDKEWMQEAVRIKAHKVDKPVEWVSLI